jgi:hypothetical protein
MQQARYYLSAPGMTCRRSNIDQILKKINQTTPRIVTASTTLTTKTKKILGPGSACLASVAVSTIRPLCFSTILQPFLICPVIQALGRK